MNLYIADDEALAKTPEINSLVQAHSEVVNVIRKQFSRTELLNFQDQAMEALAGKGLRSASIDPVNNQVELDMPAEVARRIANEASSHSLSTLPSAYAFVDHGDAVEDVGRYDDYPRYFMGGQIKGASGSCSLGIPILVSGKQGVLTAGHCTGTSFSTPSGRFVGSQFTTTYPGNAHIYGDWKILTGSTYAPSVFTGPAGSSSASSASILGHRSRPVGYGVCSSGATTGQICRYIVRRTDTKSTYLNGPTVGSLSELYHDSNLDGVPDCGGWNGGDSGGSIFSASGTPGRMYVHGLLSVHSGEKTGNCVYLYTQFSGVLKWNPNIRVLS